jgi:hypothetical protein
MLAGPPDQLARIVHGCNQPVDVSDAVENPVDVFYSLIRTTKLGVTLLDLRPGFLQIRDIADGNHELGTVTRSGIGRLVTWSSLKPRGEWLGTPALHANDDLFVLGIAEECAKAFAFGEDVFDTSA